MAKAILVPIDFTPVSLNALNYACALRNEAVPDVVAVHLLDPKIADGGLGDNAKNNPAMKKVFLNMQQEILAKTREDLENFVQQQQQAGISIRPLVAFGTIYDSFAGIADSENAVLTIMGTHGIVGMQHLTGSRAYKTVLQSAHPFLVVQTKPYYTPFRWYLVFKNRAQLQACAPELMAMQDCLPGTFVMNVVDGLTELPAALASLSERITLVNEPLNHDESILKRAATHGANAVGYCMDETEDNDAGIYGLSQARIMANQAELPVLCLSAK